MVRERGVKLERKCVNCGKISKGYKLRKFCVDCACSNLREMAKTLFMRKPKCQY